MVDLPTLKDFTGAVGGGGGLAGNFVILLLVLMCSVLFIVFLIFLWNWLSYNVNVSIFDGITTVKSKAKYSKVENLIRFKLRGMRNVFVVQPTDEQFYYEKPALPFLPVKKHVFFAKVNDVLIPTVISVSKEARNIKLMVGEEKSDGTVTDVLLPLTLQVNPHFDTKEINLRSFLSNELAWADETYKELKSKLMQLLPYALVIMGMVISLIMVMFTLQFVGKRV